MLGQFPVAMPDALSPSSSASKAGSDDSQLDVADRKKKNADAQAAFRARRANYIATLEETGLSIRPAALAAIVLVAAMLTPCTCP